MGPTCLVCRYKRARVSSSPLRGISPRQQRLVQTDEYRAMRHRFASRAIRTFRPAAQAQFPRDEQQALVVGIKNSSPDVFTSVQLFGTCSRVLFVAETSASQPPPADPRQKRQLTTFSAQLVSTADNSCPWRATSGVRSGPRLVGELREGNREIFLKG